MSMTGKIGCSAISSMLSAYILGVRIADPAIEQGGFPYRIVVAGLVFAFSVTLFCRHLSQLHKTLEKIGAEHPEIRQHDGRMLFP